MIKERHLIIDGHLDLAMNALEWNRDLRLPVHEIRSRETGLTDLPDRAHGTVSLPAMREGNICLCFATQIARFVKPENKLPGWKSPEQAWAHTQGQLAWYRTMEEAGEMLQIRNKADLKKHIEEWNANEVNTPVGYILSLEGADSIISLRHLEIAFNYGLRIIGPAHYGPGTYAQGTDATGGLGKKGRELIREIERSGIILDVTHLCDESFWETMDYYKGPLLASHNNCRKFVNHNRQFSDDQIKELIKREAVIGIPLDAWMMVPGWIRGKSDPKTMMVTLKQMVDNIDYICQLSGTSHHSAIGSDLDGGFGTEQCPSDLDTIADLQKVPVMLNEIGYSITDIRNIMSDNWIRFLRKNLCN